MARSLSWLDSLLFGLRALWYGGAQMPERSALEFTGAGVSVADDASTKRTVITIPGASGSVASVSAVAPLANTGTSTAPVIEMTGVISNTQHGSRGGGSLHAAATTSTAGFMSAADKTKLDGLPAPEDAATTDYVDTAIAGVGGGGPDLSSSAPADIGTTASAGSSSDAARADHVHDLTEAVVRTVLGQLSADASCNGHGFTSCTGITGSGAVAVTAGGTSSITLTPGSSAGAVDVVKAGLAATPAAALRALNTTAALVGTQVQASPWVEVGGNAWVSGATASHKTRWRTLPRTSGNVDEIHEYSTDGGANWSTAYYYTTSDDSQFIAGLYSFCFLLGSYGIIDKSTGSSIVCGYNAAWRIESLYDGEPQTYYGEGGHAFEVPGGTALDFDPNLALADFGDTEEVRCKQMTSVPVVVAHSSSGTRALNLRDGSRHELDLSANITSLSVSNGKAGATFSILIRQDGTGGRTVTFAGGFVGTTQLSAALDTGANRGTSYHFVISDGGLAVPLSEPYSWPAT